MIQWSTDEEFVHLVRSGQLTLRAGTQLTHRQMVLLGMTQGTTMSQDSLHGAPGSRMAQDAATAERHLAAAAQEQRTRDLESAAQGSGSPEQRIAQTIEAQMAHNPTWQALERQRRQHVFVNAGLDPIHSMAAKLEAQQLPRVQAESGGMAKALAKRVLDQFEDAEVRPGPSRRAGRDEALADIRQRLDKVEKLLHRLLGATTHPDRVREPLAAVRQIREQIRSLVAVA